MNRKCCANCMKYEHCRNADPDRCYEEMCTAWAGSSNPKTRKNLQNKRKKAKKIRKSAVLQWFLAIFTCFLLFLALGKVGNSDLKAELNCPDDMTVREFLDNQD